ncbi:MAG: hypothetical protein MUO50_15115, partial [Longimicrobiales bacterium]|nr:hypothetical protein [Longimicrobiales bacterium]
AFGFGRVTQRLELKRGREVDVRIELVPEPLELPPLVVVSERRSRLEVLGFYERRRLGQGYSLTREEIETRRPALASDLFRMVPGVRRPLHTPDPLRVLGPRGVGAWLGLSSEKPERRWVRLRTLPPLLLLIPA